MLQLRLKCIHLGLLLMCFLMVLGAPFTSRVLAQQAVPKPPFPTLEQATKGMVKVGSGLFELYRYKPGDPGKDMSRLLCRISIKKLNRDLLFASSISSGQYAGWMWNDHLVRFQVTGKYVILSEPDTRHVTAKNKPVSDAVRRTHLGQVLAAMPIVGMAGKDPIVDLGSVLISNVADLPASGKISRHLSSYAKVKVFPTNALIGVNLLVGREPIQVSYAFRELPPLGSYRSRKADERVGYFTTVRKDWNVAPDKRDLAVRMINRWQLEKRDPSLELSPPKQPIVFIIEKSVPLRWRRWVRDGIQEWNKAFEAIGFSEAIVVQQQTTSNEYANIDPEDARYNFIRWIVSGRAFAMGPSVVDPRTGQILDADIIFDDAMLRYFVDDANRFSIQSMAAHAGPELMDFARKHPYFTQSMGGLDGTGAQSGNQSKKKRHPMLNRLPAGLKADEQADCPCAADEEVSYMSRRHGAACLQASGRQHQMAMMHFTAIQMATTSGQKFPERLVGEMLKETVTHEVGHAIGLRHNFKASSWLTMDKLKQRRDNTDEPLSASVMDYNPAMVFAGDDPMKVRHITNHCLGPYDMWAVQYGYAVPTKADGTEAKMLDKILSRSTERPLAFATDEDTRSGAPDPYTNRWDASDDPIAWAKSRAELSDQLLKEVTKWAVKKEDPNHYLTSIYNSLIWEKAYNTQFVARLVGGQFFSRSRASERKEMAPLKVVDPKVQRAAIKHLGETVFSERFLVSEDPEIYNHLVSNRWSDWVANRTSGRIDYPLHERILRMQSYPLVRLLDPNLIQRIYDAELKGKAENKFTAAELLVKLRGVIWSEVYQPKDGKIAIGSVRRNLQLRYLDYMLPLASDSQRGTWGLSPDVENMIKYCVRELELTLKDARQVEKMDYATRAHLVECHSRIKRALDEVYITIAE